MGAVFWQLNTDWKAPSFSTIDHSGSWKLSQNLVKDVFSEVLISGVFTDNDTL